MKRIAALFVAVCLGSSLIASAQEYVPTPVTVSKEKVKLGGKVYLSHVVLEKQTLFSISRAYGVTEEELYQANPTLRETGLQKNAILLIPYKEAALQADGSATPQQDYTEHTVRWYEDIDDIARRYDVSPKEIMEANGLKSRKLTTRQVLKIPIRKPAVEETPATEETPVNQEEEAAPEQPEETPLPAQEEGVEEHSSLLTLTKDIVEFSLVLPLKSGASESNMDFYSGVLLALKDMEAEGLKVKAHVYDLSVALPPMDMLEKSDFVLGPIVSRDLEAILQRLDGKAPVISPLDQKAASLSQHYHNFIQVPSAPENQYEDLAQWVKEEAGPDDRIILVTEKGASNISASVSVRSALAQREVNYEILTYSIVEGRGIPTTLSSIMTQEGVNRVLVASESEAFVGDAVRNLGIMLGKGYDVVMYAPSKVRTFDTIEGSAYHDVSLHISTSYHADYANPAVDRFVRAYRSLFRTEPSQFAFQGYDTTRFFAQKVASGLHTDFSFTPDANGNLMNRAVRRIVFKKDYTTVIER